MKKFIKINGIINKQGNKIALLVALVVGFIRYGICNEVTCAVSYALTALIIAQLVLFVYKIIAKQIIAKAIAKNPKAFVENVVFDGGAVANSPENKTETEADEVQAVEVEKGDKTRI